ncbi:hypothetical protein G6F63_014242 [Rhizopus arrhizus]|nr:hypothetical protein G6F63_014242 [Rhizopus arrhizus]
MSTLPTPAAAVVAADVARALAEDLGSGDVTAALLPDQADSAYLLCKQDGVIAGLAWFQLAGSRALPAALPLVLVFPFLGIADAGLGFHVVEPGIFDTVAAGPDVLAGDRASVAADALVQVQHHRDLCTDLHHTTSLLADAEAPAGCSSSHQSILSILRTITNSSRGVPQVQ